MVVESLFIQTNGKLVCHLTVGGRNFTNVWLTTNPDLDSVKQLKIWCEETFSVKEWAHQPSIPGFVAVFERSANV